MLRHLGVYFLLLLGGLTAGCSVGGDSGIAPPLDRIFLPTGAAVEPSGRWLLVVNSNSDLRYSFGTVVPLDLAAAKEDREVTTWPLCPSTTYRPLRNQGRFCCRDLLDTRVLNCDDRPYASKESTVRVGSFATSPVLQRYEQDGQLVGRLFLGVRADPSITFVDVRATASGVSLRCSGPVVPAGADPVGARNARCDRNWRVETGALEGQETLLPEEPFSLALDPALGVLYVGHLFGGLSAIDVCAPGTVAPRLGSVVAFPYGREQSAGVTAITPSAVGDPTATIFTTARSGYYLGRLLFRAGSAMAACNQQPPRDLALVPGEPLAATAFVPRGGETRGLLYQPQRQRAFVLHRNSGGNPAALVRLRMVEDASGAAQLWPSEAIDVCAGPAELLLHDAGRGDRLYIPCFESGQVYVVDPETMVVTSQVEAGRGPASLTFDPLDPTVAYVTGYVDNNVAVLDLRPGSTTEGRIVQRLGFPRTSREL